MTTNFFRELYLATSKKALKNINHQRLIKFSYYLLYNPSVRTRIVALTEIFDRQANNPKNPGRTLA